MKDFNLQLYDYCSSFVSTIFSADKEFLQNDVKTQNLIKSFCIEILCCFIVIEKSKKFN